MMEWRVALFSFLVLFPGMEAVPHCFENHRFHGTPGLPNMSPLFTTTAANQGACAIACTRHPACQSFSFRSGRLGCRLFPKRIMAPDLSSSSLDVYFYKTWPSCPTWKGYVIVPGTSKCLLISNTAVSWNQAADTCFSLGGHLLIFEDAAVMQKVQAFLPRGTPFHVGANDLAVEDQHRWLDGTPVDRTTFYPPNPNDANIALVEDCIGIVSTMPGLHDISCVSFVAKFVCSVPVLV